MESVAERTARTLTLESRRAARRAGGDGGEERALTASNAQPLLASTAAGPAITPRNALAVADAYACVRALADAAASLPLHVFRRAGDGGRERTLDAPASDLLSRPAPGVTQAMLVAQLMAHLNLHGEAFVGKYRDESGAIHQLGLLAPERVGVELRGGLPLYTVTTEDGRKGTYGQGDVIHVRGLTLDGLRGISPVKQAREALGLASSLAEHGSRTFANGATPKGILKVPAGPDSADVVENLRAGWEGRHGSAKNAGRVAVLQADVTFEAVSMTLADAEFLAQRELSTREVARIFRVPSWLINGASADSLTYSTVAESMRAFVLTALKPWLVFIEQALGADEDLFPAESRTYPSFVLDGLLRGDPKARAEVYATALDPVTGWMRREEVRVLEDLPAEPTRQEEPANA